MTSKVRRGEVPGNTLERNAGTAVRAKPKRIALRRPLRLQVAHLQKVEPTAG
jgi:hypothetical protein